MEFEVVSIRPATRTHGPAGAAPPAPPPPPPPPGGPPCFSSQTIDAGRVALVCISLKELLLKAFPVYPNALLAPDWTDSTAFDITANLPERASRDQLPEMFQSLLEDRFGLTFHRGTKEGAVNALVVAKAGLKMSPAAPASAQPPWVSAAAAMKGPYNYGAGGVRIISVPGSSGATDLVLQSPSMGFVRRSDDGGPGGIIHYEAPSITFEGLAALVKFLGPGMDPSVGVVDMTGIKGRYQAKLDVSMADLIAEIEAGAREPATLQSAWLNIMQDGLKKLGLQLERRKAPVDVIVVDHLEKTATAN
jgi:uncharacterized protein (TIGR03435 family)